MIAVRSLVALAVAFAYAFPAHPALADAPAYCTDETAQIDRPSIGGNPCVLGGDRAAIEAGYYQNASAVGQTQLAAYPEARMRYAALPSAELFLDAPNEIAVAGPAVPRRDAYTDQPGGFGASVTAYDGARSALGASFEYGPPNPAYSAIDARARYSATVDAGIRLGAALRLTGTVRLVDGHPYGSAQPGDAGFYEALSADYRLSASTSAGLESGTSDGVHRDRSRAQSLGGAFVQRDLARNVFFDANVGTAFNAMKRTKPHYLGSGLVYRL